VVEERQGVKVACVEEIAWRNGWISDSELRQQAEQLAKSSYGEYLFKLLR
jgi:glucose-1-phosphate thymidylyltransferase